MPRLISIALVLLLACTVAHAEFLSGRGLLDALDASGRSERDQAAGYIAGVVDTSTEDLDDHERSKFCFVLPETITLAETIEIVHKFLRREARGADHANLDTLHASGLVRVALAAKHGCSKST